MYKTALPNIITIVIIIIDISLLRKNGIMHSTMSTTENNSTYINSTGKTY